MSAIPPTAVAGEATSFPQGSDVTEGRMRPSRLRSDLDQFLLNGMQGALQET